MNATNDDSVAREYRYVVVLADGRVYDPDKPISKKMKEMLELKLPEVPEEMETEEGGEHEAEGDTESVSAKLLGVIAPGELTRDQLCEMLKKRKQEAAEEREQILKLRTLTQSARERLIVKLNDLLAQGWVPLRETSFGYGCLLVLTRPCPADDPPKKRGSTSTSKGRGGDMTKGRGR